jgi:hypothetical protein
MATESRVTGAGHDEGSEGENAQPLSNREPCVDLACFYRSI